MNIVRLCILSSILWMSGCTDKPKIPQAGEVVVWKWNDQLVFKARLGQRREHIVDTHCPKCERDFYNPQYDRYLGQFPIDYVPEKFDNLTAAAIKAMPIAVSNTGAIEFSLMLNGAKGKATDESPYNLKESSLDDLNQVKVFVRNYRFSLDGKPNLNTKQSFETYLMDELVKHSKKSMNGLDCYNFKDHDGQRCFGLSRQKQDSGFQFYVSSDKNSNILVYSEDPVLFGGLEIQWFTSQRNIKQAQDIEAAIWRLINTWNASSLSKTFIK
jgi:hypothetical protein